MDSFAIDGERILKAGCGIGLPSLVLQFRGALLVASNTHPRAAAFLACNPAINGWPSVHYRHLDRDMPLSTAAGQIHRGYCMSGAARRWCADRGPASASAYTTQHR